MCGADALRGTFYLATDRSASNATRGGTELRSKLQIGRKMPRWRTLLSFLSARKVLGADTPPHRINLICRAEKMENLAPRF